MTTSHKPTIRATAHVRRAEKYLGGPLDETLKPYLNERGTMSDLAHAIGVQKATVNYWIMRLGIKYARVAYDEDEVVRVYSREEAEVADVAIESGIDADDLERLDGASLTEYSEFKAKGPGDAAFASLSPEDLELLESVKSRSFRSADFDGFTSKKLQDCQRLEDAGLSISKLADMSLADLKRLASMASDDVQMLDTLRSAGWEDSARMEDDLEMIETTRKAGWSDVATAREDMELLQWVKDNGLDLARLESLKSVFGSVGAPR